jgi:capsular exopolysaccharide synthesis family protein
MGKMQKALKKAQQAQSKGAVATADAATADAATGGAAAHVSDRPTEVVRSNTFRADLDPHLVALVEPQGHHAQQYRMLARNLDRLADETPISSIVVTSAEGGEGRSLTAANLACILAENEDRKVVLVDADLRSPKLHDLFALDNQHGLSDYLAGGTMLEMVVQKCRKKNMWVLPSGRVPGNPAELLGSKRMDDLLTRLGRDYDVAVIDAPSVATGDPAILGPRVDGLLMVVRMGRTSAKSVKSAVSKLEQAESRVLGTLLSGLASGS